ncbi:MAG TPA: CoA-binding protein [Roseiflexaceae bacterium]|nr:CoA-binding protein [Roseiflexaceae bacterium]
MLSDIEIKDLLERARTIAVVGLSDRPERDSHAIAAFLLRQGYRVLPVNPNLRGPLLGQPPYASLRDIAEPVDIVNVFRRSEYVAGVVEDAIAIRAGAVWTQSGVEDQAAARRAEAAGLKVVMNRCIAVTYRFLRVERNTQHVLD